MALQETQDLFFLGLKMKIQKSVDISELSGLCALRQRPEILHLRAGQSILRGRVRLADSGTKPPLERAGLGLTFPKQSARVVAEVPELALVVFCRQPQGLILTLAGR